MYNLTDTNTLSALTQPVPNLFSRFEASCENAIDRFKLSSVIANSEKVQTILLRKERFDLTHLHLNVDDKGKKCVELLGIILDNKLDFNSKLHIS